ncbi:zinc-binding dehydrogenase [Halobacillus trueperi]|uniref:Zinc-binding alcohol dehydrogenase n=1 Tax=Halobacillus trueperi TaxID=156205 RepID=A0A3E0JB07_9BACI|nr:zinc-binding dehydrogenase [Halobacillus trueperi]REJ10101.1 zinc-binding alcohol dehydrogenase [Halobacillus trueperi]
MKALVLQGKNQWKEMKVEEVEKPQPQKGEVLIEVHAAGLNPVDYKTATNGNPNWTYPHILGLDAAGTIAEIGEGVTEWRKGDRVVFHGDLLRKGAYAQYTVTTAHTISRIPDEISFEEAAALPTAGYTAYQAIHRKLPLDQVKTLLIHAGAGGVGGFAIQLAKAAGKTVITTASAHNHDHVRKLGADFVIDYRNEEVHQRVKEITEGKGVDAVVDAVSRDNATASLDFLAFMGHLVYIAGAPDFAKVKPFTDVVSYHEVALGATHQADVESQKDLAVIGDKMLEMMVEGKLSSLLEETISLEKVPQALERQSERHVKGKIVAKLTS